jgi:sugar lactone lactonase YvrE
MRVAVDGSGNIYALGRFNNAVFKFGRDGEFINRFGDAGDQPGQLRAPYSIAVDGHGRVYVGDMKGIQVFDANGRYLSIVNLKGMAFGMVFNDNNELFVIARDHVVKYAVQPE